MSASFHRSSFPRCSHKSIEKTDRPLTKVCLILYSEVSSLRNTVHLPDSMLHGVLSIALIELCVAISLVLLN